MPLLISNEEIERLLTMEDVIGVLESAYRALGEGQAVNRPRTHTFLPHPVPEQIYEFKSMEGGIPHLGVYALRIASDVLRMPVVDGITRREKIPALPGSRWLGLVLLFRVEDGALIAIFPDGIVQSFRVAATSALAARYQSRPDSRTLGLIGSGWQAQAQCLAMKAVRPLEEIRVFSPTAANREQFASQMTARLGIPVIPVSSAEKAVRGADIVSVATNASQPVLKGAYLEPGQHLTALVGGDEQYKRRELDDEAIRRCRRIVVNDREQIRRVGQDDLLGAIAAGQVTWDEIGELGELVAGRTLGRRTRDEITLFKNNVGLGIQFAAVGALIHSRAGAAKAGRELPLDWFTQTVHP